MRFTTIENTAAEFSGVRDWEWHDGLSFEGLCNFAWGWAKQDDDPNDIIRAYIESIGENPADYDLEGLDNER